MSGAVSSPSGSGLCIAIPPSVAEEFKNLKTKRKYSWLMLSINMETFSLEVKKTGSPGSKQLQELVSSLPPASGAYIVYDLPVQNSYGGAGSSLKFITWAPACAPGKTTVAYAQQRRSLNSVFTGCVDITCTTKGDVEKALGAKSGEEEEDWDPDS